MKFVFDFYYDKENAECVIYELTRFGCKLVTPFKIIVDNSMTATDVTEKLYRMFNEHKIFEIKIHVV